MFLPTSAMSTAAKLLLLLLISLGSPSWVLGQQKTQYDLAPIIQDQSQKWVRALITRDYATMVDYMPERIVTRMGGKEEALKLLKKSSDAMKEKGFAVEEATLGVPVPPQRIEGMLVSVMTQTLSLKTPQTKVTQESHLLALSADEGQAWKFVDLGPLTDEKLYGVFPELKGKFKLPAKKTPVQEKSP